MSRENSAVPDAAAVGIDQRSVRSGDSCDPTSVPLTLPEPSVSDAGIRTPYPSQHHIIASASPASSLVSVGLAFLHGDYVPFAADAETQARMTMWCAAISSGCNGQCDTYCIA